MSRDERANRLDRIIVYATIGMETFAFKDVLGIMAAGNCQYEPEEIKQSLARLELAFVLEQRKMKYAFRVPIFKKMIVEQGPEELLKMELRGR